MKIGNGCWEWTASRDTGGYGAFGIDGKLKRAHRVAFELTKGAIPDGFCVLHRCDNPGCVNPAHLWVGTVADNMADKAAKGRISAKLTESGVVAIRRAYERGGVSQQQLAQEYSVTQTLISHIVNRTIWRHC